MAREIWKPVVGYEGFYEVSSLGRIKRLARYIRTKNDCFKLHPTAILAFRVSRAGYPETTLSREGDSRTVNVHRLVCEAFHGPPPTRSHQTAHVDGSRDNNAAGNLCWKTAAENAADRIVHGTERMGEEIHHLAKLTADQVLDIRARYRPHRIGYKALGRGYGVSATAIMQIVKRKHWKHI